MRKDVPVGRQGLGDLSLHLKGAALLLQLRDLRHLRASVADGAPAKSIDLTRYRVRPVLSILRGRRRGRSPVDLRPRTAGGAANSECIMEPPLTFHGDVTMIHARERAGGSCHPGLSRGARLP